MAVSGPLGDVQQVVSRAADDRAIGSGLDLARLRWVRIEELDSAWQPPTVEAEGELIQIVVNLLGVTDP